jgi:HD superfamily phosphohydrolase
MGTKIFRDPLYNYIGIDRSRDGWLLDLLDCPEVQRLRRIHQLGISYLTYPSADHNRLAHSLGVLHLMQQVFEQLTKFGPDEEIESARVPLLAGALIHDVGHGPFSHVFEPCLGTDHEEWSRKVLLDEDTKIGKALRRLGPALPRTIAELIDKNNQDQPAWAKYLLSSQLDMDRVDYLRRDSLFTGGGYGHFDWYRLLNSLELHDTGDGNRDIVWAEKSKLAIEEYIFARFYMYQNVYLHKTTRGFEKMLEAMWRRARQFHGEGTAVGWVPALRAFWGTDAPSVREYLQIEEFTVLSQVQAWIEHPDKGLSELARRFLGRERLAMVEAPAPENELAPNYEAWEAELLALVGSRVEYDPPEMFCLRDNLKGKYHQPYFPEKESDEQSVKNAIRVKVQGQSKPVEISALLPRLRPVTQELVEQVRYYVPKELQAEANQLRARWRG